MSFTLSIITASTSGHTDYVVDVILQNLREVMPDIGIDKQRAEKASAMDLLRGGRAGQLNPHMHELLMERAKDIDLQGKPATFISLGDDRFYFRTRCTEHFLRFIRTHNGKQLLPPLVIVNEPYEQEEKITLWAKKFMDALKKLPTPSSTLL
jgi:flavodoxin